MKIKSEQISISPYLNAFQLYEQSKPYGRQSFSYANPLNHNFNITINFGANLKGKTYTKSNLKATIHLFKYDYYELENSESYLLNTICKFEYGTVPIYFYKTVCCRATIQDYNFTTNDFYTQNFCKYAQSRHSSACFIQLLFSKSFISKINKRSHFYFGLKAFIFATNSETCNQNSKVTEILAVSRLYPLSFSTGLGVVWNMMFISKKNISLDLGRPLHSLEPDSLVSLPVRINIDQPFQFLKIECHLGDNLDIQSIIFDSSIYDGDYDNSIRTNSIASIDLTFRSFDMERTSQWWIEKGILLFIIRAHVSESSVYSAKMSIKNSWIKCFIKQMKENNGDRYVDVQSSQTISVPLLINSGKFIVIPIFEVNPYFSILSDFQLPIKLQEDSLKVYSIHNVRDGSFVDVTNKVSCKPVDPRNIQCPNSMMKSTDGYFSFDKIVAESTNKRLLTSKWDIILQLYTWHSVIFSPLELWSAENWRLEISDRTLTEISGWRFPMRSITTQRMICPPLFQAAHLKVIARLSKRNEIGEKEYYGMNDNNKAPLLDLSSQLQQNSIRLFTTSNAQLLFNLKSSYLHVSSLSDYGSVDVQLLSTTTNRLLTLDRISIAHNHVTIEGLKVFCIESMDLYENSLDILSNYRQFYVDYSHENNTNNMCFLSVIIVFSDLSKVSLGDISIKYYRLSRTIFDFKSQRAVVRQISLLKPVRFAPVMNLSLYESSVCHNAKLIFSGIVSINYVVDTDNIPVSGHFVTKSSKISNEPTVVTIHKTPNVDLIKDLSSLYYGLYALITLVAVAALVVLINCLFKLNYRKISRQIANANNQAVTDKLLNTTQSPTSVDASSPNFVKHPPLLPPPGPLRNSSDSQQELASSAFWSISSQESDNLCKKNYSYSYHENAMPFSALSSPTIRSSPLVGSMYANHRYAHNPSPSSDQADGGYLSSENTSKYFETMCKQTVPEIKQLSSEQIELSENISELASSSGMFPVPPPCPPLKWSIQWATSMGSIIPLFSQSCLSNNVQNNCQIIARTVSTSDSGSTAKKFTQLTHAVPYTKSIDNLCEKSSGLGSLTSTQQEDSSLLSDEDNYHVSINNDKETYRKYIKKC